MKKRQIENQFKAADAKIYPDYIGRVGKKPVLLPEEAEESIKI